jgi:hypothetical protein
VALILRGCGLAPNSLHAIEVDAPASEYIRRARTAAGESEIAKSVDQQLVVPACIKDLPNVCSSRERTGAHDPYAQVATMRTTEP